MRILVIEDNERHIADAKNFFDGQTDVEVEYASNMETALPHLKPDAVDGVISDIIFPYDGSRRSYKPNGAQGAIIAALCHERVIPCVLITDSSHHSENNNWVCGTARSLHLPELIDCVRNPGDPMAVKGKRWEDALITLHRLIEAGPCNKHGRYHLVHKSLPGNTSFLRIKACE